MIEKGATWQGYGFNGAACQFGHTDIVKFLIEKGIREWNYGLWKACQGDHLDIAKLMIEKGATKCGYGCNKTIKEHLAKK